MVLVRRYLRWLRFRTGVREEGVALLSVAIMLAIITITAEDFSFHASVDFASARNARDELRAHYLARSGINLSKLLLKVQSKVFDANRKLFGDIQISEFAPVIISAFNDEEGAKSLAGLLGVEGSGIKGLGVDRGSFDLEMTSLDGKLNINCGGGPNTGAPRVIRFAAAVAGMLLPDRYNRLFEEPDEDGQYADRAEVLRAIIDWTDFDSQIFGSSAAEDYHYNARDEDAYQIKNQYFDTVDELRLIRGVDDDFMAAFGNELTVYGDCKVNVGLAGASLITALIIQHAADPHDPALRWENLALLTQYLVQIRNMMGGFSDQNAFAKAVEDPLGQLGMASLVDGAMGGEGRPNESLASVAGVKLDSKKLAESIAGSGPRRIWRIVATSQVGRVKKKISTIWDVKHVSMQASRHQMGPGAFLYWREE